MVKVIFLENIEDYKIGDVREVPDGYARNFLFRKGIAKVATENEIAEIQSKMKQFEKEEAQKVVEAEKIAEKITKLKLALPKEVNEEGHLYGSVTNKEIADALETKKFEIDPANIVIEEQIKELGPTTVLVKVGHGIETELKLEITRK